MPERQVSRREANVERAGVPKYATTNKTPSNKSVAAKTRSDACILACSTNTTTVIP